MLKRCTAAFLPLALLAGCSEGVLNPAGAVGEADRTILLGSMVIMLAIIVPAIVATLGFAWWFRAGNTRAVYRPNWAYSGRVELVVWSVPLMTIMLLGGVTWVGSHDLDPAKRLVSDKPALEVQVVSLDWKWLFIYPDQKLALVNQLVVPAGVPVHFALTSASVMNAFFVPQLGSMIYTMNGMRSELNLVADRPGTFAGLSAHFSGDGFPDMHFAVRSLPEDQFAAWVKTTQATPLQLDEAAYNALAKQGSKSPPPAFGAVAPDLFDRIVSQKIPPAAGPQEQ